jgi:DNA-binding response OmpR family regulator
MRPSLRVLLIEGEPELLGSLTRFLESEGYTVATAADGVLGLNLVRRWQPDLIILDAELAGIDGITLCGAIRSQADTPLILLTSGRDELQQVIGLDRGADLCMVKPIALGELRARIRALLRRATSLAALRGHPLVVGDVRVDVQVRRAWLGEQELQLTPKEFELLAYLMRHRGMALSRDQLLKDVWGGRVAPSSQTLDVHIRWLRQKVEPDPNQPVYIRTVRMIGYRFEGPA